jgi:hypothetical protein
MTPPENFYPPTHLSDADVQRETYAGVKVLLERTADLPQIRAKVTQHDVTLRNLKRITWGFVGVVFTGLSAAIRSYFKAHYQP